MEWLGLKMGGCGGGAQEVLPFSRSENGKTSRHHRIHPFLTLTTPFRATRVSFHALIPFSYTGEGWLGFGNRFITFKEVYHLQFWTLQFFFIRHSENFTWKKKNIFLGACLSVTLVRQNSNCLVNEKKSVGPAKVIKNHKYLYLWPKKTIDFKLWYLMTYSLISFGNHLRHSPHR